MLWQKLVLLAKARAAAGGGCPAGGADEDGSSSGPVDSEAGVDQHTRSSAAAAAAAAAASSRAAGQSAVLHGPESSNTDTTEVLLQHLSQNCSLTPSKAEGLGDQQEARVKLLNVQEQQQQSASHSLPTQPHAGITSSGTQGRQQQQDRCSSAGDSQAELQQLIWHPSDAAVKPIVANRRIERLAEPSWDATALPFAPLTLQSMLECDQGELERFLTQVRG
jgi:hypothetical protein